MDTRWTCSLSGRRSKDWPLDYIAQAPDALFDLPKDERRSRAVLTPEFCTIDGTEQYIYGILEMPVRGQAEKLKWGVWAVIGDDTLKRFRQLNARYNTSREPAHIGWLATALPIYPSTVNLKVQVLYRGSLLRPLIRLDECTHPAAIAQREGVDRAEIATIAAACLGDREPAPPPRWISERRPIIGEAFAA
jgi:hypothetical protein